MKTRLSEQRRIGRFVTAAGNAHPQRCQTVPTFSRAPALGQFDEQHVHWSTRAAFHWSLVHRRRYTSRYHHGIHAVGLQGIASADASIILRPPRGLRPLRAAPGTFYGRPRQEFPSRAADRILDSTPRIQFEHAIFRRAHPFRTAHRIHRGFTNSEQVPDRSPFKFFLRPGKTGTSFYLPKMFGAVCAPSDVGAIPPASQQIRAAEVPRLPEGLLPRCASCAFRGSSC